MMGMLETTLKAKPIPSGKRTVMWVREQVKWRIQSYSLPADFFM